MATAKELMAQLNKKYKDSIVSAYSDLGEDMSVNRLKSGSKKLNVALGGGWAFGRLNYLLGGESSGKSTLALLAIAECQKVHKRLAVYVDLEKAFNPEYAAKLGVDVENLIIARPDTIEEAFDVTIAMTQTREVGIVVFDSVASGDLEKKRSGDSAESILGIKAKQSSENLPTIITNISKNDVCFLVINQYREKIGIMFGNPTTDTGGKSWKYYASITLEITANASARLKEGDNVIGSVVKFKVAKNKVSAPFKEGSYNIIFGEGIDELQAIIELAEKYEIITKKGTWYKYEDTTIGQGVNGVKDTLYDNVELLTVIENKVNEAMAL